MKTISTLAPVDLSSTIQKSRQRWYAQPLFLLLPLSLALGLGLWFWWSQVEKAKHQLPPYATELLKRGDIALTITATGNLFPTNQVTVGSELSGTTLEVYVDFNDHVTKGQPLVKLDTSKLTQQTESSRATVQSAQAKVAQADATVQETSKSLARQQELQRLSNGQATSRLDFDAVVALAARAQADLLSSQAIVREAEAQVRINENDLAKALIKSPIDGVVLSRNIEPGQTVASSFTAPQLFIIAEKLERMKLEVAIAEADIGRVAQGQLATFTVDAWPDHTYAATVSIVAYGSAVTQNVVTYEADLDVNNDDLSLRPGMTATADIRVAESKNVFLVPTAALRFHPAAATDATQSAPKKSFVQSLIPIIPRPRSKGAKTGEAASTKALTHAQVWVLRAGTPEAIPVKLGLSDGSYTEISGEGLSEGLLIILRATPPPA